MTPKKFSRRALVAACAASAFAFPAGLVCAQQAKEVKLGYALAVNSHYGAGAQAWADSVEKATNNAFKFIGRSNFSHVAGQLLAGQVAEQQRHNNEAQGGQTAPPQRSREFKPSS